MNPKILLSLLVSLFFFSLPLPAQDKDVAKAEERAKEEKRKDENAARENAARVKVARFDSVARSPKQTDIDVYQAGETVGKPCKVIALLTFECAAHEETQAVSGFIVKAKELGADGVVMLRFDSPNANQALPNLLSPNDRRVFRANPIIYREAHP